MRLLNQYQIEAIAIGNGTGGRETEAFIRSLDLPKSLSILMVNESGASIYSASDVARQEFPDRDITVREQILPTAAGIAVERPADGQLAGVSD